MTMRFAVGNTDNGLLLYMNEEARRFLTGHVSVSVMDSALIVYKGGGININDGKHNSTEINCQGHVRAEPLGGRDRFGKSEFRFSVDGQDRVIIDLKQPIDGLKKPRVYKSKEDRPQPEPTDDEISRAVAVINRLDRSRYTLTLQTPPEQKLSIRRTETFE